MALRYRSQADKSAVRQSIVRLHFSIVAHPLLCKAFFFLGIAQYFVQETIAIGRTGEPVAPRSLSGKHTNVYS